MPPLRSCYAARIAATAALLGGSLGQVFDAIVTGAKPHATYVRLIAPPVEGRLVRGEGGLDVGDKDACG